MIIKIWMIIENIIVMIMICFGWNNDDKTNEKTNKKDWIVIMKSWLFKKKVIKNSLVSNW